MKSDLISVLYGRKIDVTSHPLFEERWDVFEEAKDNFVEKLGLDNIQIDELDKLLEYTRSIERLGFLFAYKLAISSSIDEHEYMDLAEKFLGYSKETKRNIINHTLELLNQLHPEFKQVV